ncbi:LPS export ABC transporter periplasmic protein LptC [Phenylobacterium sp.]|uniref:LPS export ABC transporter periplasmic protein LptC n=1 Tax=Phenylobacterium sp. TaxID=1871053 RepID=UPI00286C2AEC|nr:LPS export ABC transporter periplasmic protein LptC [Phenylobacterium sp.]
MPLRSDDPAIEARRRAGHLVRVRALRLSLPALALVVALVCAAQVGFGGMAAASKPTPQADVDTMLKPRFAGRGSDGKSFVITGAEGRRPDKTLGEILITDPVLTLKTATGGVSTMTATSGVFDEAAHALVLTGQVKMANASGSRFTAQQARIDTRSGTVSGQRGLQVENSSGVLQSGTYSADEDGDRVILKGGVRGRFNPKN